MGNAWGPGTGQTHVIKLIKEELFEKILKWNTSVEFQIVALQAVMADLLQGDTIHHAFNIPVFGRNYSTRPVHLGSNKDIQNAKAVLQYRCIIIDEISMVSAKLLACLLYTSPSPRDKRQSRMPSSA